MADDTNRVVPVLTTAERDALLDPGGSNEDTRRRARRALTAAPVLTDGQWRALATAAEKGATVLAGGPGAVPVRNRARQALEKLATAWNRVRR